MTKTCTNSKFVRKRWGGSSPTTLHRNEPQQKTPPGQTQTAYLIKLAESWGFEPQMGFGAHTRLAGEHLRPLGQLSVTARR